MIRKHKKDITQSDNKFKPKRCAYFLVWLLVALLCIPVKSGFKSLAAATDGDEDAQMGALGASGDTLETLDSAVVSPGPSEEAETASDLSSASSGLGDEDSGSDSGAESSSSSIQSYRDQISDSRDKISEYEKRRDELNGLISDMDATLAELSSLKNDAASYISALDENISNMDSQINNLSLQIDEVAKEIESTTLELEEVKENETTQYNNMKLRIRYMYENGSQSMIDALFESGSISEFLNKAEYISNVTQYDRDKLNEFVDLRHAVEAKEDELSSQQELLKASQAKLTEEKGELETLQQEKQSEIENYNNQISGVQQDADTLSADMASIQAAIQAEENAMAAAEERIRAEEEEARKKAEEAGETYTPKSVGDIYFSWPCPSSSRITSYFGDRESPTEGASTNHKGIDIGASSGSPVLAAASGEVVIATYSTSAGNYIMLSHGGGVYTVYMHMSSMSVSVGDQVTGGAQIGAVGSTGYSTGPHLHFGIRIDGVYVNPLDYVSN